MYGSDGVCGVLRDLGPHIHTQRSGAIVFRDTVHGELKHWLWGWDTNTQTHNNNTYKDDIGRYIQLLVSAGHSYMSISCQHNISIFILHFIMIVHNSSTTICQCKTSKRLYT